MERGNRGCQGRIDEEGKMGTSRIKKCKLDTCTGSFFICIFCITLTIRITKLTGHKETREMIPKISHQHVASLNTGIDLHISWSN